MERLDGLFGGVRVLRRVREGKGLKLTCDTSEGSNVDLESRSIHQFVPYLDFDRSVH